MKNKPDQNLTLSHATLEKIFAAYHVPKQGHDGKNPGLILFAFRGGLPSRAMQSWGKSVKLKSLPVDHIHMHCTLGIWDPAGKRLFVAPGSTVPHKNQVEVAAARKGKLKGKGTNQMEPGYYTDLTKGEHLQGKRNGHQALRQTANRFYRRSPTGLPFTKASPLFFGNPYDNLHCGWNLDGLAEGFSSAGCLVVAGLPYCPRREDSQKNAGPWKIFHDLIYAANQQKFSLLLLPIESAMNALIGQPSGASGLKSRLVYGSMGDAVKKLQRLLSIRKVYRGRETGILDARTYRAWMKT